MKQTQFTLSDFLGYVIPGASALVVMLLFYHYPSEDYSSVNSFLQVVKQYSYLMIEKSKTMGFILPSAFIILSYIVGHLLAFLSSITVERFTIWLYGYPSCFLFSKVGWSHIFFDVKKMCDRRSLHWRWKVFVYALIRIIVIILLLPLSSVVFFLKLVSVDGFIVRSLDPFLKDVVEKKLSSLRALLKMPNDNEYRDADLHRVVHEYCYSKYECVRQKMDNYVAIYDLMRSLTLVMVYASWMLIIKNFKLLFTAFSPWAVIIGSLILTLLFFMAFMKFYRRFTLESYICIASDKDL